jgi:hypothetical protein
MDQCFLPHVPSIIAASGLYLARKMLNAGPWNISLSHYSSYAEEELIPVVELMLDYIRIPVEFECIYIKYCSNGFMRSAIIAEKWIEKEDEGKEKVEEDEDKEKVEENKDKEEEDMIKDEEDKEDEGWAMYILNWILA